MATYKELKERLEGKQDALAKIFAQAKTPTGEYDFDRVELDSATTTKEKLDKVGALNKECDDLFDQCKAAGEAEGAWKNLQGKFGTPANGVPAPITGIKQSEKPELKTLGEQLIKCEAYTTFTKNHQIGVISQLDWGLLELKLPSHMTRYELKTLFERGAGWGPEVIRQPGFVEAVTRPVQVLDIIPTGTTNASSIKYMEETTRTHASAERAEGTAYAESTFVMTERTQAVEKVTDSVPTTDEQLEDVAQAESYLTERLQFGLRQRVDSQSLVGDGISPNLKGILAHTIQTQVKGADPTPDAIYKAMTKVRFTGRAVPTNVVMHPNDWQDVRLLRTADGVYIWGNPSEAGPERIWGIPVVLSDALTENTGLVGSFLPPWIMLFNRRGIDVQMGYINDQFTKGIRTIRADLRTALVVFRAAAFCSVTGI